MKVLSFLPTLLGRSCPRPAWPASTPLRATALELAILAGHLLVYPSGLIPERRPLSPSPRSDTPGAQDGTPGHDTGPARLPHSADSTGRLTDRAGNNPTGGKRTKNTKPPTATAPGRPSAAAGDGRPPVLLLHGFIDNRSVFVLLRRSLARHGWHHLESLNYSPLTCDIRAAAELLGRHVEEIRARTGHSEIDIVGHSLGGLIARYYVQRLGGDRRVRTLVTLGTPHGGTAFAPLAGAHPIVRQMRSGSDLIEELRRPAPGCRTRFISFWSELDRIMLPVETACVDHPDLDALNVRVTGIGHLALPVHPAVAAAVRQYLESDAVAERPGAASVA
ncbi:MULTISPECIES: lipase family alpha/beta hydrolase [Streptomyces]|uniref:Alpha/beta fold hydrolase n=2 Tax=Streptomyces TaxID=1883 RepID=A0ABU2RKZ3_9ACTN|nr:MULTISPECIES: alpha/beta fold hydrolase [unclassified Streptomyces]MBK3596035.1 alpha/beta fold hydrolase [Streptomyces sp. MBT51]MDT0428114.1 alpha/beta fold hydrolase [Streptomyces sp. DSM 41770]